MDAHDRLVIRKIIERACQLSGHDVDWIMTGPRRYCDLGSKSGYGLWDPMQIAHVHCEDTTRRWRPAWARRTILVDIGNKTEEGEVDDIIDNEIDISIGDTGWAEVEDKRIIEIPEGGRVAEVDLLVHRRPGHLPNEWREVVAHELALWMVKRVPAKAVAERLTAIVSRALETAEGRCCSIARGYWEILQRQDVGSEVPGWPEIGNQP